MIVPPVPRAHFDDVAVLIQPILRALTAYELLVDSGVAIDTAIALLAYKSNAIVRAIFPFSI